MIPWSVRRRLPTSVRRVFRAVATRLLFADSESWRTFRLAVNCSDRARRGERFSVRVRALRGKEVILRRGTSDLEVFFYTYFHRFHLPPRALDLHSDAALTIVDLGANIGLTMAHFASLFPRARILGVELSRENMLLCESNVSRYDGRCRVFEGAVWSENGLVEYDPSGYCEDAYVARPLGSPDASGSIAVQAMTIDSLLHQNGVTVVDFLKIDVEGAERVLFRGASEWPRRIRGLKVEVHGTYTRNQCMADLERLGFKTSIDRNHPAGVIGLRHRSAMA